MSTKFMQCSSAGTISTVSLQAYGTWEFDMYKGADGNSSLFSFISDSSVWSARNGYMVGFNSSEQLKLWSTTSGSSSALFETATSYIDINTWYRLKVARLESEGVFLDIPTLQVSDLVNLDYTTFTSNGRYGFEATSDGSATYYAGTADEIPIIDTVKYLVEFDLTLNSGTAPQVLLMALLGSTTRSDIMTTQSGRNSFILTATGTVTGVLAFRNNTAVAGDYKISGLTIRRIYDADSFAVFIKGSTFVDTYQLVDTTGGSGTNPVVDSTYTTSQYMVADLDAGDRLSRIILNDGVQQ